MPKDINFIYSFHAAPTGAQTVTANVTRGDIPVAPEPAYIELDVTGFTLPAPRHVTMDPELQYLQYTTVWKKDGVAVSGQYNSPIDSKFNEKGVVRGPRFMWLFDEVGTYTADVTVINMYDHTEVATTTLGPFVVQDYLTFFDHPDRAFWPVALDGDYTGLPAGVAHSAGNFPKTDLAHVASSMQNRGPGGHVCILLKQGETHTLGADFFNANTPNIYIRTYTGNLGTARPILTGNSPLQFGGSFPAERRSVQVSGLAYQGALDVFDPNENTNGAQKFFNNPTGNHLMAVHDCYSRGASIVFQGNSSAGGKGIIQDCDFSESILCNMLGGFGAFTGIIGSRMTYAKDAPSSYPNSSSGWSIRCGEEIHMWQNEIGAKQGHDATDAIQPALRIGRSTKPKGGGYSYVSANTLFSNVAYGTSSSNSNHQTSENGVFEGNHVSMQSQRLSAPITTIMTGILGYNNIAVIPSANPHLGTGQFNGKNGMGWATIAGLNGLQPDADVLDAGLEAQFNTMVSLSDASTTNDVFIQTGLPNGSPHRIDAITDENNTAYAPYQSTAFGASVNLSQFGSVSHVVPPYEAFDVAVQHGTGVAEDMVTLTGTGLGFAAGDTFTQGSVTAEIYVVQESGGETRLWLANTTGGAFAAGAASSAGGSGILNGPAVYRGTMINATPDAPVAATSKTWVPPVDHYGNARSYAGAIEGAVETA